MCRTAWESKSGSYAGRIAPPGMPKTTSAPTLSRLRTSDCAPVSASVMGGPSGGAGKKEPLVREARRGERDCWTSAVALANYDHDAHVASLPARGAGCQLSETHVSDAGTHALVHGGAPGLRGHLK